MALLLLTLSVYATGQTNPFLGNWSVTWEGGRRNYEATLVITQSGGTWRTLANKSRNDNCVGLEAPIAIQSTTSDAMTIQLKFSDALQGCTDSKVILKRVDENTLTGTRGRSELKLTRKIEQ